jgi:hypothetical protein
LRCSIPSASWDNGSVQHSTLQECVSDVTKDDRELVSVPALVVGTFNSVKLRLDPLAVTFDSGHVVDEVCAPSSTPTQQMPHTLPGPELFAHRFILSEQPTFTLSLFPFLLAVPCVSAADVLCSCFLAGATRNKSSFNSVWRESTKQQKPFAGSHGIRRGAQEPAVVS